MSAAPGPVKIATFNDNPCCGRCARGLRVRGSPPLLFIADVATKAQASGGAGDQGNVRAIPCPYDLG